MFVNVYMHEMSVKLCVCDVLQVNVCILYARRPWCEVQGSQRDKLWREENSFSLEQLHYPEELTCFNLPVF